MRKRRYACTLSQRVGAIRREIAATVGMLALVLNLIGGLALSVRPVLALDATGARVSTIICGTAPIDREDDPSGGTPLPAGALHCIFCLPLMAGGLLPAESAPVLLRMAQLLPLVPRRPDGVQRCALRGPPPARGPPSI